MHAWPSGDITANGMNLRYHRTGGDKPALLIAHGVTDNGLSWSRIAGDLQEEYDVILYDRRGHGFSDAPESGYSFEDHARDMAALIMALELERPHIVGHSGGAVAAAILAATHPDLLNSLVLEDPAWGTGWGGWEPTVAGLTEWFLGVVSMSRQELVELCRETNSNWREEEIALWADSKVQVSPNVVQTFEQPEPLWRDIIQRITRPILLIAGNPEKGALNTAKDIEAIASVWHRGQTVTLDGGHVVHNDQYEAYVAAVKTFLARVRFG